MIYEKPKLGINGYECSCLGIISDGFKTETDAYQWIVNKLVDLLNLYVDWGDPDNNLLARKAESNNKLLAQCIKAKTTIGQLRPSKCLCNKTMVRFCDRCSADLAINELDNVIKATKPASQLER